MTPRSVRVRARRPSSLAGGVVAVVLGVVALVASAPLVVLQSGGWPWTTSMTEETDPPSATARIVEEDGTVHQSAGTPSTTRAWLVATEDQLKKSHGIDTKIAVGRVLSWVGVALLVAGCVVLLYRQVSRRRGLGIPAHLADNDQTDGHRGEPRTRTARGD